MGTEFSFEERLEEPDLTRAQDDKVKNAAVKSSALSRFPCFDE